MKNNLDKLRKLKGLTQEEFAKELKVSRQTVSAIENGKYNPSLDLAFEIALYFNKTIEEIFIYEEIEEIKEKDNKSIVKRKQIELIPMNEEEALLQMELLGHDFFIFKDSDSMDIKVLYKRKDGNYGLIEEDK